MLRKTLERALEHSLDYLDTLDQAPVGATADVHTLRRQLQKPLNEEGLPAEQVIDELVASVKGGILGSAGGRFFGWVIGGSTPASLAADWLTSAWDQNASLYACSPAAAIAEEVAGAWLKELFGLPAGASFGLVTGCQGAHTTCLAAARHRVLKNEGWDVEERGLAGSPVIRVLAGEHGHHTLERAMRLLGLGRANLHPVAIDAQGRLLPDALEKALSPGPTIVVLQAGDINIGAYDDFEQLIPVARKHGAWVHVDGAFGLWAAASPKLRHLVKGVERANSWATDGHKWLNVPYDCGYAFVADPEAHRASLSYLAPYLSPKLSNDEQARDQMNWNPDSSRRARGFPTYAAIRELGRNGIADMIERCCRHAKALVKGIGSLPGAEVLWESEINQGLVRFGGDDARTNEVIAAIIQTGEAYFGGTTWRGKRAMRISVSNWRTSEADVERVIAAVKRALNDAPPT
jgi:glutamate/tyrosine decarboxylase-like PLP-dependent enzyme